MLDGGTRLIRYHTTETDSSGSSYKIPCMADFLIVHSTVEGNFDEIIILPVHPVLREHRSVFSLNCQKCYIGWCNMYRLLLMAEPGNRYVVHPGPLPRNPRAPRDDWSAQNDDHRRPKSRPRLRILQRSLRWASWPKTGAQHHVDAHPRFVLPTENRHLKRASGDCRLQIDDVVAVGYPVHIPTV